MLRSGKYIYTTQDTTVKYNKISQKSRCYTWDAVKKTTKKLVKVCFFGELIKEADEILQKTRK